MKNVFKALTVSHRLACWAMSFAALAVCLAASLPAYAQPAARGFNPDFSSNNEPALPTHREPQFAPIGPQVNVVEVRFEGNTRTSNSTLRSLVRTRANRNLDPQTVQADVRQLIASKLFSDVRTRQEDTPQGVIITFQVVERGLIEFIRFVGNEGASERQLNKEVGLTIGEALDSFSVEEGKRRVQEYYQRNGYTLAYVSVAEGLEPGDRGITYMVDEGPKQRVRWTSFEGNDFVSDSRLRTQIQSKPGYFWLFKGKVVPDEIDRDVDRLVAYYHSLGFFGVHIGREVVFSDSDAWADITFYIVEGPRYSVRNVYFSGNQRYTSDQLAGQLELLPGDDFLRSDLQGDLLRINDLYGSQGFVFADIQPEVQFLEEPGQVDLVFDIQEGDQYRVGDIHIYMEGSYGGNSVTRDRTVLNRLDLYPGEILDTRRLRTAERRLQHSQLFMSNPAQGQVPTISVLPPELQDVGGRDMAYTVPAVTYRAQSESFDRTSPWRPMPLPQAQAQAPMSHQAPGSGVDRSSPWQPTQETTEYQSVAPQMTPTSWYENR